MKTLNVVPGSPEWIAARRNCDTASEAPAMMGASQNTKRNELLYMKTTGSEKEFSEWVRREILDKGHAVEAMARPIAEKIIGDELFPAVVTDDEGHLLASLDGMTMMGEVIWEHKQYSAELFAEVQSGKCPECHIWQVIQALVITGAEKCLFMISDGTEENCAHVWVELCIDDAARLKAGWKQFNADRAAYVPTAPAVEVMAEPTLSLPSVSVQVSGSLAVVSNLSMFGEKLKAFIADIPENPSTDQEFANCEAAIKVLKKAEEALDAAESSALAQVVAVDEMCRLKALLSDTARTARLMQEKLVKNKKETIRLETMQAAQEALFEHMETLNKRLGGKVRMPNVVADFAGVMKGLKTVTSLKNAVDTELARVKIESSTIADKIDINLGSLRELANNHIFLFSDAQQLAMKANDDLVLLIKSRIADHEAAEKARIEREVQARLAEEQRKAKEAEDRLKADAARAEAEEKRKSEQEALDAVKAAAPVVEVAAPAIVAPTPQPEKVVSIAKAERPSDDEMIAVLSIHYRAHESKVIEWLLDMDMNEASVRMAKAI